MATPNDMSGVAWNRPHIPPHKPARRTLLTGGGRVRLLFAANLLALTGVKAGAAADSPGNDSLADAAVQPYFIHWSFQLVFLALLAVAGVAFWNERMRKTVRERTRELREEVDRRERVERELRTHQSMLADAERAAHMGSWERDFRTDRVIWSHEMFRIFGLDPATFSGTYAEFLTRVHPDDRPRRDAALARALHGGNATAVEYRIRRPDGTERIVFERSELVRDEAGRPLRKLGMLMDVSEQRHSERSLREKDELLRMAGHLGRIAGWVVELPERRVIWSDEAGALHEMPPGSSPSLGQVLQTYAPEFRETVRRAFEECVSRGRPYELEVRLSLPSGRRSWVRIIGEPARDEQGVIVRVKGAIQDVTERKALEQQFLRAQRQESIGTLAGGIAHDLNNVLTPILMSIDLLRLNARAPDDLRILDTIGSSARRGAEMIRQVLSYARGAPGTRVPTPARHLVRDIERIVQDTFPKSIGCELRVDDDVWPVLCDPTQIHQVLLNLCVNARDSMPDGGVLALRVRNSEPDPRDTRFPGADQAGRLVRFDVSDTGVGIPVELREKIFDPFFTTKEVGKGTGLGLSTVANIVRAHGGHVRLSSEIGRGSTFTLHLPAADGHVAETDSSPGFALARGNGEMVLLVDDEQAVRSITRQILEGLGYRVMEAENGADAVALFVQRRGEIDVVLTDIMMPIMDGLTAIRTFLSIDPGLPVVAASGLNAATDADEAVSAGARRFLPKPFTAETLLDALRGVLEETEARRGRR